MCPSYFYPLRQSEFQVWHTRGPPENLEEWLSGVMGNLEKNTRNRATLSEEKGGAANSIAPPTSTVPRENMKTVFVILGQFSLVSHLSVGQNMALFGVEFFGRRFPMWKFCVYSSFVRRKMDLFVRDSAHAWSAFYNLLCKIDKLFINILAALWREIYNGMSRT